MTEIAYIAFDPGGSNKPSTGMATFSSTGELLGKVKLTHQQFTDTLVLFSSIANEIKAIIVETFVGRPGMAYGGNKMKTSQQIGAIKFFAAQHGIKLVEQAPDKKDMGRLYSGTKKTWARHMPDDISAYCHGYYYLHLNKIIKPKVLEDKELHSGN